MNKLNRAILSSIDVIKRINYVRWILASMLLLFLNSSLFDLIISEGESVSINQALSLFVIAISASICFATAGYRAVAYTSVYKKRIAVIIDLLIIAGLLVIYLRIESTLVIAPYLFATILAGYTFGMYGYYFQTVAENQNS